MSDSILIRLRHHSKDERNTAFARSTMREAADELARVTAQRDAILKQARIWSGEAKAQKATVDAVGEILGGVPDWGPIAQGVEQLRAELAACREREARMQWQPIETAPTDGARILLCGKGGKIADGYYGQPDGFANPKQFVWPYIHANPTHWMPLQAPPAALAEGAQG